MLQKKILDLQKFDWQKVQNDIIELEWKVWKISGEQLPLLENKKWEVGIKLWEIKVELEADKHTYQQHKTIRDEVYKEYKTQEDAYLLQATWRGGEIKNRHDGLWNLMKNAKDVG